jgi:uncharacterized protein YkwD
MITRGTNVQPSTSAIAVRTVIAHTAAVLSVLLLCATAHLLAAPNAHADNKRLNDGVVANVRTARAQSGCTTHLGVSPQLQVAAQRHTDDLLNNRALDGDTGTDGSSPQDRATAVGYRGSVAETVAIHPALAVSGLELLRKWYFDPTSSAIMRDCAHTQIGVWSENSLDRSVVVAVYGTPT